MSTKRDLLKELTDGFTNEKLTHFFRNASPDFKPVMEDLTRQIEPDPGFIRSIRKLGDIIFPDERRLVVVSSLLNGAITEHTSKRKQFDIGWKYLKKEF
ncbi:MAG: hypothetical protein ACFCU6_01145 [Balneolaceae bacterium]